VTENWIVDNQESTTDRNRLLGGRGTKYIGRMQSIGWHEVEEQRRAHSIDGRAQRDGGARVA
jgi:hypothetical protein